jgi:hypothetical protein
MMDDVWKQRAFFLRDIGGTPLFCFVRDNIVNAYIALPDGTIIYMHNVGNRSGTDTTTTDNCWGHLFIAFYLTLLIARDHLKREITYEEILRYTLFSLYGDDNLGSFLKKFWNLSPEQLKEYVLRAYSHFGVVVKPSQFQVKEGSDISGLEFLGSTFHLSDGAYSPLPRFGKLYTSLTRVLDDKGPLPVASCLSSIYDLVAGIKHPEAVQLTELVVDYATFLLDYEPFKLECNSEVLNMLARVSTRPSTDYLRLGYESSI